VSMMGATNATVSIDLSSNMITAYYAYQIPHFLLLDAFILHRGILIEPAGTHLHLQTALTNNGLPGQGRDNVRGVEHRNEIGSITHDGYEGKGEHLPNPIKSQCLPLSGHCMIFQTRMPASMVSGCQEPGESRRG
jgi:hypothetical protein